MNDVDLNMLGRPRFDNPAFEPPERPTTAELLGRYRAELIENKVGDEFLIDGLVRDAASNLLEQGFIVRIKEKK